MNKKLNEFKHYIRNKKVAVLGIGISNIPLIKYLCNLGVDVTAFDKSEESKLKCSLIDFEGGNVKFCLGINYLDSLKGFDIIFRTPGVRYDIPELVKAVEEGAELTSEMEVFMDLCPAEIFAVTGSDGKTTTTTLIYKMLKAEGYKCWLGGNIGNPLLSQIDEIKESDKVVLELSSFQLHTMKKSPHIAVITNLSPNHLDVHKSMEEYVEAKKNIYKYQTQGSKLILNYDNKITKSFADEAKGEVRFFCRINELDNGATLKNKKLVYKFVDKQIEIVEDEDILIHGVHNVENYLAAIAAVIDYVEPNTIKEVATTFKGVEHRNEAIAEIEGVRFYNDSIASSPTRTIASLRSFRHKVILITGGYDKKIPYDSMGEVIIEKVKLLILIGKTGPKIEKALIDEIERTGEGKDIPVIYKSTLEDAVYTAYENAEVGDIITLSPASASFDMFRNFEERGNRFREIVNELNIK